MQLRYRVSLEDYIEAQRLIRRIQGIHRLIWLVRLILILLGGASLFSLGYSYFRGPGELSATWLNVRPAVYVYCLVFLFGWVLYPMQLKRSYRKNPMLQREISVDFDENLMHADDGAGGTSDLPWSHYDQFAEGSRAFVVRTPGNVFSIISKSQMSSEQVEALRSVLAKNLKKK